MDGWCVRFNSFVRLVVCKWPVSSVEPKIWVGYFKATNWYQNIAWHWSKWPKIGWSKAKTRPGSFNFGSICIFLTLTEIAIKFWFDIGQNNQKNGRSKSNIRPRSSNFGCIEMVRCFASVQPSSKLKSNFGLTSVKMTKNGRSKSTIRPGTSNFGCIEMVRCFASF